MAAKHRDRIPGGKADSSKPTDFDPKELAMGIEIEAEHTGDPQTAMEIAMDHLKEFPDYYTRLKRMERKAEKSLRSKKESVMDISSALNWLQELREAIDITSPTGRALHTVKHMAGGGDPETASDVPNAIAMMRKMAAKRGKVKRKGVQPKKMKGLTGESLVSLAAMKYRRFMEAKARAVPPPIPAAAMKKKPTAGLVGQGQQRTAGGVQPRAKGTPPPIPAAAKRKPKSDVGQALDIVRKTTKEGELARRRAADAPARAQKQAAQHKADVANIQRTGTRHGTTGLGIRRGFSVARAGGTDKPVDPRVAMTGRAVKKRASLGASRSYFGPVIDECRAALA